LSLNIAKQLNNLLCDCYEKEKKLFREGRANEKARLPQAKIFREEDVGYKKITLKIKNQLCKKNICIDQTDL
jgi:hypothetical protein